MLENVETLEEELEGVVLVDLFGGIAGARVACEAVGRDVRAHVYVEKDVIAAKAVTAPTASQRRSICHTL